MKKHVVREDNVLCLYLKGRMEHPNVPTSLFSFPDKRDFDTFFCRKEQLTCYFGTA